MFHVVFFKKPAHKQLCTYTIHIIDMILFVFINIHVYSPYIKNGEFPNFFSLFDRKKTNAYNVCPYTRGKNCIQYSNKLGWIMLIIKLIS